jgi:hypothetical protein
MNFTASLICVGLQPQLERQLARLVRLEADGRIDVLLIDGSG